MKPTLQNRWKVVNNRIIYYGLRNFPNTYNNIIKLSSNTVKILKEMNGVKDLSAYPKNLKIKRLIKKGIIVDVFKKHKNPDSLDDATYCTTCVANNYIIPGLEFDKNGNCPLCQNRENDKKLVAFLPQKLNIKPNNNLDYDVAVFYTGGKDSSYLLYYLAKVLKLKVLALTWKLPYMSDNALQSIENARTKLPNVKFIIKEADAKSLEKIYAEHYKIAGNTCMCPSIAYILFYPMLVENKVPYIVLGNEPVQIKNLLYNQIAPRFTYNPKILKLFHLIINIGRVITFRKPYRNGQIEMLTLVKGLARGSVWGKKQYGRYQNESSQNVFRALKAAPNEFLCEFKEAIKKSSRKNTPALIHIDFNNTFSDGVYHWKKVKDLLIKELNWVDSKDDNKSLHTSCKIEKCKDFTQLNRFRKMESRTIPFSSIEMSLAVADGCITKEKAISELKLHSGFCLECEKEYKIMVDVIKK